MEDREDGFSCAGDPTPLCLLYFEGEGEMETEREREGGHGHRDCAILWRLLYLHIVCVSKFNIQYDYGTANGDLQWETREMAPDTYQRHSLSLIANVRW